MSSEGSATSPAEHAGSRLDNGQDNSAGDAPLPPDDQRVLEEEIERTREQLGATVEALAAKADLKSRMIGPAKDQVRQRSAEAATSISNATPEPVKRAAGNAAAVARRHRGAVAVAGAAGAAMLGWLLINRWRRR